MTLPDVDWLAIAPELVLALGAAAVLLLDVAYRPGFPRLGGLAALSLAAGIGLAIWQWAAWSPDAGAPLPFGGMVVADRLAASGRLLVLVVAAADRAYTARDPFTAGERLQLVRAGLGDLSARTWLIALPAPTWPAMALAQLAFVAPTYDTIVAHNPILRAMAEQQGKHVESLPEPFALAAQAVSATRVRARLAQESAGTWLSEFVPNATAALLCATPALAERCALIARAEG